MKRTLKTISSLILAVSIGFILTQCKDDENAETKYYKLNGKVSLADNTVAVGAIVMISSLPNAGNVVAKTFTDEGGNYSFMGLANGTYYLNARYEPSNKNNLKSAGTVILTGAEIEVAVDADKTADLVMTGAVSGGTADFSLTEWSWDNTHSTIGFEFPYDAVNAVFKGHFTRAGFDVLEFDEANPSATQIKAWVDITSVETGASSGICGHGRDGITGCIQGTFGLETNPNDTATTLYCEDGTLAQGYPNTTLSDYDLWGDQSTTTYQKQSAIVGSSGVATFKSTEVTAYGNGYIAKGDFTFAGVKKSVDLYFSYLEGYTKDDQTKTYVSFFGWFKFAAEADFGIVSGHVGDAEVTVNLSAQFNKAL